ncbi:hypothetical protein GCM10011365_01480 [Marinicella pacifica]|uniref:Uncharacterized protein n=2 Tax=Marinicella pacifica TaxID=1171543 RepID=A0A917CCG5_9GAMM|nr:hypothetical protein [Marinicella pacifica]GGF84260.1 hypothetical protein GCM10011365_01480 [Marinicella pacifica]
MFLTLAKVFTVWIIILVMAIMNGTFRESVLIPKIGIRSGFFISGLILSVLILIVTYLTLPWLNIHRNSELIVVGCGWLFLTLMFEFSFGLFRGLSFQKIFEAYTFKDGNIWPVVLLVTALAPLMAGWMRG